MKALALAANVAEEAQVEGAIAKATAEFGALHGLINNAGILRDGLLIKTKEAK